MNEQTPHHGGSYVRDPKTGDLARKEWTAEAGTEAGPQSPAANTAAAKPADNTKRQTASEGDGK